MKGYKGEDAKRLQKEGQRSCSESCKLVNRGLPDGCISGCSSLLNGDKGIEITGWKISREKVAVVKIINKA